MVKKNRDDVCQNAELKCPECRGPLAVPRTRADTDKPLVCGGCGRRFDCSDLPAVSAKG
jgi:hypothetical protein